MERFQTVIRTRNQELPIETMGTVLSDWQILHALRFAGIIPKDSRDYWCISAPFQGIPSLMMQERLPSGHLSTRIQDYGQITVDGYAYQSHGYSNPAIKFGSLNYSFVKIA